MASDRNSSPPVLPDNLSWDRLESHIAPLCIGVSRRNISISESEKCSGLVTSSILAESHDMGFSEFEDWVASRTHVDRRVQSPPARREKLILTPNKSKNRRVFSGIRNYDIYVTERKSPQPSGEFDWLTEHSRALTTVRRQLHDLYSLYRTSLARLEDAQKQAWYRLIAQAEVEFKCIDLRNRKCRFGARMIEIVNALSEMETAGRTMVKKEQLNAATDLLLVARAYVGHVLLCKSEEELSRILSLSSNSYVAAASITKKNHTELLRAREEVLIAALQCRVAIISEMSVTQVEIISSFIEGYNTITHSKFERLKKQDEEGRVLRRALYVQGVELDRQWARSRFNEATSSGEPTGSASAMLGALMGTSLGVNSQQKLKYILDELENSEEEIRTTITAAEDKVSCDMFSVLRQYERMRLNAGRVEELTRIFWDCINDAPKIYFTVDNAIIPCTLFEHMTENVPLEPTTVFRIEMSSFWTLRIRLLHDDILKWLQRYHETIMEVAPVIVRQLQSCESTYKAVGLNDSVYGEPNQMLWIQSMFSNVLDVRDFTETRETIMCSITEIKKSKERIVSGVIIYVLSNELLRIRARLAFYSKTPAEGKSEKDCNNCFNTARVTDQPWEIIIGRHGSVLALRVPTGATCNEIAERLHSVYIVTPWSPLYTEVCVEQDKQDVEEESILERLLYYCPPDLEIPPSAGLDETVECSPQLKTPYIASVSVVFTFFMLKKRQYTEEEDPQSAAFSRKKIEAALARCARSGDGTFSVERRLLRQRLLFKALRKVRPMPTCEKVQKVFTIDICVASRPITVNEGDGTIDREIQSHDARAGPLQLITPSVITFCEPPLLIRVNLMVRLVTDENGLSSPLFTRGGRYVEDDKLKKSSELMNTLLKEAMKKTASCTRLIPVMTQAQKVGDSMPQKYLPQQKSLFEKLEVRGYFTQASTIRMEDTLKFELSCESKKTISSKTITPEIELNDQKIYMAFQDETNGEIIQAPVATYKLLSDTEILLALGSGPQITTYVVQRLLALICYTNCSVDPTYGVRKVEFRFNSLTSSWMQSLAKVSFSVWASDDPTSIANYYPLIKTFPPILTTGSIFSFENELEIESSSENPFGSCAGTPVHSQADHSFTTNGTQILKSQSSPLLLLNTDRVAAEFRNFVPDEIRFVFYGVEVVDDDTSFFTGGWLEIRLLKSNSDKKRDLDDRELALLPSTGFRLLIQSSADAPRPGVDVGLCVHTNCELHTRTRAENQYPTNRDDAVSEQTTVAVFDDGFLLGHVFFGKNMAISRTCISKTNENTYDPGHLCAYIRIEFAEGCSATLEGVQEVLRRVGFVSNNLEKDVEAHLKFYVGATAGRFDVEGNEVPGVMEEDPLVTTVRIEAPREPLACLIMKSQEILGDASSRLPVLVAQPHNVRLATLRIDLENLKTNVALILEREGRAVARRRIGSPIVSSADKKSRARGAAPLRFINVLTTYGHRYSPVRIFDMENAGELRLNMGALLSPGSEDPVGNVAGSFIRVELVDGYEDGDQLVLLPSSGPRLVHVTSIYVVPNRKKCAKRSVGDSFILESPRSRSSQVNNSRASFSIAAASPTLQQRDSIDFNSSESDALNFFNIMLSKEIEVPMKSFPMRSKIPAALLTESPHEVLTDLFLASVLSLRSFCARFLAVPDESAEGVTPLHPLLIAASCNRRSVKYFPTKPQLEQENSDLFEPCQKNDGTVSDPDDLEVMVQRAMRARKIHKMRQETRCSTTDALNEKSDVGHVALIKKASKYLVQDYISLLGLYGLLSDVKVNSSGLPAESLLLVNNIVSVNKIMWSNFLKDGRRETHHFTKKINFGSIEQHNLEDQPSNAREKSMFGNGLLFVITGGIPADPVRYSSVEIQERSVIESLRVTLSSDAAVPVKKQKRHKKKKEDSVELPPLLIKHKNNILDSLAQFVTTEEQRQALTAEMDRTAPAKWARVIMPLAQLSQPNIDFFCARTGRGSHGEGGVHAERTAAIVISFSTVSSDIASLPQMHSAVASLLHRIAYVTTKEHPKILRKVLRVTIGAAGSLLNKETTENDTMNSNEKFYPGGRVSFLRYILVVPPSKTMFEEDDNLARAVEEDEETGNNVEKTPVVLAHLNSTFM